MRKIGEPFFICTALYMYMIIDIQDGIYQQANILTDPHMRLAHANKPDQCGAYKSYTLSLLQMYLILGTVSDFVKMYASWSFELMKLIVVHLKRIFF